MMKRRLPALIPARPWRSAAAMMASLGISGHTKPMKALRMVSPAAASLFALAVLTACTFRVDIDADDLKTPTLLVERLPITVGVHYDEKLRNYYHVGALSERRGGMIGPNDEYEYYLGPPSVALFDPLFSSMFAKVVPVEDPSTATIDGEKLSGVLSLTITSFVAPYGGRLHTRIIYILEVYAPPGVKKTSIAAHGTTELEDIDFSLSSIVARAMRNAAADLVVNFYGDPEVVAWLASLSISEHGTE